MMVRINKVYTKTGDNGDTGLVGGKRIPKDHIRIEGYGTVDELNSIIGISRAFLEDNNVYTKTKKLDVILESIQQLLFDIGSEMATIPGDEYEGQIRIDSEDIKWLEEVIDLMNNELPPLKSFILPGGSKFNTFLHLARTVCRRAERNLIRLHRQEKIRVEVRIFLNRLSDFFFVASRWASKNLDKKEVLWIPGKKRPNLEW